MKIFLHQTNITLGDFDSVYKYLEEISRKEDLEGLHIFPELFTTGYPLQDLCLQQEFIETYQELLQKLNQLSKDLPQNDQFFGFIFGGLDYQIQQRQLPEKIFNAAYLMSPGKDLKCIYHKRLLPNYDIYDEKKYFSHGNENCILNIQDKNFAIIICEDMWHSSAHFIDPMEELHKEVKKKNIQLSGIINLSASPFHIGKIDKRIIRAKELSETFNTHFIYVNQVCLQDEILFDGQSFIVHPNGDINKLEAFQEGTLEEELSSIPNKPLGVYQEQTENTWQDLFKPHLRKSSPPLLKELGDKELEEISSSLIYGLREYAKKCHFKKFLVALSGGIDSALVLALAYLAKKEDFEVEAIFMPSKYSSSLSYDLTQQMCKNLEIPLRMINIKFFHQSIRLGFADAMGEPLEGLSDENIQSRIRGNLLYARSNQTNSLVINTSNKSELAVGYSTLYGDSVGAISLLGDLYKSEVYKLSEYLNRKYDQIIPEEIITRAPSAELRDDQVDQDSLPPYEVLDGILEGLLSYRFSKKQLLEQGFQENDVLKVSDLLCKSEYKRFQFCPILKIKSKSFGFGYRVPILKA